MIDCILLIFFAVIPAIVLHEVAHGLTAYLFGDQTAKNQGRLTLNPISHLDLFGSLIIPGSLFLMHYFGLTKTLMLFGWAKPVPVSFMHLRPRRLGMMVVAFAGPLTNIIIAYGLIQLYVQPRMHGVSHLIGWAIMLNLTLAVFNMIPIPPLDGSRIVTSLLPAQLAFQYNRIEPYGFFILIILLQLNMLKFIYPIISWLGALLGMQL